MAFLSIFWIPPLTNRLPPLHPYLWCRRLYWWSRRPLDKCHSRSICWHCLGNFLNFRISVICWTLAPSFYAEVFQNTRNVKSALRIIVLGNPRISKLENCGNVCSNICLNVGVWRWWILYVWNSATLKLLLFEIWKLGNFETLMSELWFVEIWTILEALKL